MPSRLAIRPYTNSILFNGTNSSLLKSSPVGINTGTNSVTIACWVYLVSDTLGTICALETATNNTRCVLIGQLAGTYFVFSDGVSVNKNITKFSFDTYIGTYKWRRIVYSISGSNIDMWSDGVNILSTTNSINTNALTRLVFGKRIVGGSDIQFLNGYLKDAQIYNNYFTTADVQADYYDAKMPYTPVSSFAMEEGSGATVGDSVGSNTLTAANTTWSSTFLPMSARKTTSGTDSRLVYRNITTSIDVATNAGILVNNASSLNPTDYVALEIWVKPGGSNVVLFDNSTSGVTQSYFLTLSADGSVGWYSTIGGIVRNIVPGSYSARIPIYQWSFVSATYNGSSIQLFANGNLLASLSCTGTLGTNSGQLRIGQYFNTGVPVAGWISQPRIYHVNNYDLTFHKARYYDALEDQTMNSNLVLNMPMAEGGGSSIADTSGQGNNGTFSRAIWSTFSPLVSNRSQRNFTQTLRLNGTSDYIDLGPSYPIAAACDRFTAAIWFKREKDPMGGSTQQITAMFGDNDNTAQKHWNMQIQGFGRKLITTIVTTVGAKALVGNTNIFNGTWYHVVLVYDGSFIKWYINGQIDNVTTHTGQVVASTTGMFIGTGSAPIGGTYRNFGGNLSGAKYWKDRALSAQEVAQLYFDNRDDASIRASLAGEWLLNGNVLDTSGFGNHGTLSGGVYESSNLPMKDRMALS